MTGARAFILWSGGKESYLSYKKALLRGLFIKYALSYVEERSGRLIGCHLREDLIREQVKKLGVDFVPVYGDKRKGNFLKSLSETLSLLRVDAGVFGEIFQREHRSMVEGLCRRMGIRAVFPLWGMSEEVVLREVLRISKPIIVCRRVRKVPRRFLGRELDQEVISFLRDRGLSLSGEGGEYQTFVGSCEDFDIKFAPLKTFRRSYYECIDIDVEEQS